MSVYLNFLEEYVTLIIIIIIFILKKLCLELLVERGSAFAVCDLLSWNFYFFNPVLDCTCYVCTTVFVDH
jgi:hypothetical protein